MVTKSNAQVNTFEVSGSSADALADKVAEIFTEEGYQLEEGNKMEGQYGKGNKLMRALIGAFANRFVFAFRIAYKNKKAVFVFKMHGISKLSGGLIGARRYNKEYNRLVDIFELRLS
jgi:hypothetical protein